MQIEDDEAAGIGRDIADEGQVVLDKDVVDHVAEAVLVKPEARGDRGARVREVDDAHT